MGGGWFIGIIACQATRPDFTCLHGPVLERILSDEKLNSPKLGSRSILQEVHEDDEDYTEQRSNHVGDSH